MSYLVKTSSGNYYFRIRIPKRFQAQYSGKTEIRKSLHTQDFIEASYLAASLSFQLKKSWTNQMNDLLRSQLIIKTTINTNDGTIIHEAITEPDKDQAQELKALEVYAKSLQISTATVDQNVTNAVQEKSSSSQVHTKPVRGRIAGKMPEAQSNVINQSLSTSSSSHKSVSFPLLSKALNDYIAEKESVSSWSTSTSQDFRSIFKKALKMLSDKPIDEYSRQDALQFIEYLKSQQLSVKSINKYISALSSFFNYYVKHYDLPKNPFSNLQLQQRSVRQDQEKDLYTGSELKVLFENLKYNPKKPSRYWIPLIMLFSGLRPGEIAQLTKSNVVLIDNIYCFKIDDSIKVKTKHSKRIVPVHSTLIELGFIDYINSITTDRLFNELNINRTKPAGEVSQFWNRDYHTQFNIDITNKSLYSLRHNFITKLRDNDVSESYTAELAGHSKGTTMSYSRYAASGQIQKLHQIINLIKYDIQFNPYS